MKCANEGCGHDVGQHGARGYGACRYGLRGVIASLASDAELTAAGFPDECRCKRFRVRPNRAATPDARKDGGGR